MGITKLHIWKRRARCVGVSNLIPLPKREPRRATRHRMMKMSSAFLLLLVKVAYLKGVKG